VPSLVLLDASQHTLHIKLQRHKHWQLQLLSRLLPLLALPLEFQQPDDHRAACMSSLTASPLSRQAGQAGRTITSSR
jgi:hypothetical protein